MINSKLMLLYLLFLLSTVVIGIFLEIYFLPVYIFLFFIFIILTIKNIFTGLILFIFSSIFMFFVPPSEDITLLELVRGISLVVILIVWLSQKSLIGDSNFFKNKVDISLAIFLGFCVISFVPALLYSNSLSKGFRELVPFIFYGIYFVLIDTLNNKKRLMILIITIFSISLILAIRNIFNYISTVHSVKQLWQLLASRVPAGEVFLSGMAILSLSIGIFVSSKFIKILMIVISLVFIIANIFTFTRGSWLFLLISIMLLFVYFSFRNKLKLGIILLILIVGFILISNLMFDRIALPFFKTLTERFETISLSKIFSEPSIQDRIAETKGILKAISSNPITGYGLGGMYEFNSPLRRESPTWYCHNAYLFIWFKMGMLGLIAYLYFYFQIIKRGLSFYKETQNLYFKAISIGCTIFFMGNAIYTITSPTLFSKGGVFIISIFAGIIESLYRNARQIKSGEYYR